MFEMVTGRLPFVGHNWREVAFNRLEATPPVPKTLVPDLDENGRAQSSNAWSANLLTAFARFRMSSRLLPGKLTLSYARSPSPARAVSERCSWLSDWPASR